MNTILSNTLNNCKATNRSLLLLFPMTSSFLRILVNKTMCSLASNKKSRLKLSSKRLKTQITHPIRRRNLNKRCRRSNITGLAMTPNKKNITPRKPLNFTKKPLLPTPNTQMPISEWPVCKRLGNNMKILWKTMTNLLN